MWLEPFKNRHSGRRKEPIHSTIYSVAYCPCRGTLKTTTLLYEDDLKMKESINKNYDELPLFLNAKILAEVLGIAPSSAYELMHEKDFPVLKIGNRLLVEKIKFKEWIERNTGG